MTDPEARTRHAVRTYVDAVPVPPGDVESVLSQAAGAAPAQAPARRWLAPALAAASVLLVVAGATLTPALLGSGQQNSDPSRPAGTPTLPDEIRSKDWPRMPLTGTVTDSPIGRAILLYEQGIGDFVDGQDVALSADGDHYRRLNAADGVDVDYGYLLAPDGTQVAMVDTRDRHSPIRIVNLGSGTVRHFAVDAPGIAISLRDWSPDGQRIAYVVTTADDVSGYTPEGELAVLDLRSGRSSRYPDRPQVLGVAFSPDGKELAIQDGQALVVIGADGQERRRLSLPSERYTLGGPWSPDGSWLVVSREGGPEPPEGIAPVRESGPDPGLMFIDATGTNRRPPAAVVDRDLPEEALWSQGVVGWLSPDRLVLHERIRLSDAENATRPDQDGTENTLVEVRLSTGERRVISRFSDEGNGDDTDILGVQLATGLLANVEIRPAGEPDFGPWPTWARVAVAVMVGVPILVGIGLVLLITWAVRRAPRAVSRPTGGPTRW